MSVLKGHCLIVIKISKGNIRFAYHHVVSLHHHVCHQVTHTANSDTRKRKSKQNDLLLVESVLYHIYLQPVHLPAHLYSFEWKI